MAAPVAVYRFVKGSIAKVRAGAMGEEHCLSICYFEYKPRSLMFALYHVFFMARRFVYAGLIIFLEGRPFLQTSGLVLAFVSICVYQTLFRPFRNPVYNLFMAINEGSLVAMAWVFYLFVDPNENENIRSIAGWSILGIITFIVFLNLAALWSIKIKYWKTNLSNYLKSRKQRKQSQKSCVSKR